MTAFTPPTGYRDTRRQNRPPLFQIWGDQHGGIGVLMALSISVLMGFLALGLDAGLWVLERRNAQRAADTSALAAAHALNSLNSGQTITLSDVVERNLLLNKIAKDPNVSITINNPPASGPHTEDPRAVEVVVTRKVPMLLLAALKGNQFITVQTRAVAGIRGMGEHCVLGLDETASGAVTFSGTADASLTCGVASNSKNAKSLVVAGTANLQADPAQAAGGISVSGDATLTSNSPPQPYAPKIEDPYKYLEVPENIDECEPAPTFNGQPGQSFTVNPGVFCGTIKVLQQNVTFEAGIYVVRNGNVEFGADSVVTGVGVVFIFTGDTPGDVGILKIAGGAQVTLSPPTSGPFAGVVVFEDPKADSGGGARHSVLGGATTKIDGAIYAPKREVIYTGGAVGGTGCLQIISRLVTFIGNSVINNDKSVCDELGVQEILQTRVRLLE